MVFYVGKVSQRCCFKRVVILVVVVVVVLVIVILLLVFFSCSLGYTCPKTYNPADFFISTLAIEPDREKECREFVHKACDTFAHSSEGHTIQTLIQANMHNGGASGSSGVSFSSQSKVNI